MRPGLMKQTASVPCTTPRTSTCSRSCCAARQQPRTRPLPGGDISNRVGEARADPARGEARPWLFGVARNVMRRGRERSGRAAAATQALAHELESVRAASSAPAGGDQHLVAAALAALPAIDREIITMISWDRHPRQVATLLGISPNLVRVRAHRARTRLRSILAEDEETGPVGTFRQPGATRDHPRPADLDRSWRHASAGSCFPSARGISCSTRSVPLRARKP